MGMHGETVPRTPPAILYGALRSGSTLVHLMLGGHPKLLCTGECDFLFDHVVQNGQSWQIDRERLSKSRFFAAARIPLPQSDDAKTAVAEMIASLQAHGSGRLLVVLHRHLDLAYKLLGPLDTLHLVRDPRDVARSSVEIGFAGIYEFGADHWRRTEMLWRRSGSLPGIRRKEFKYEDLVVDPVAELTAICRFLGVPFDDGVFDYTRTTTYSYPDPALCEQWRTRVSRAQVARLEARLGQALADAGYAPSGFRVQSSFLHGELALRIRNRAMIWRRMLGLYGILPPVLRGLGRRLGVRKLEYIGQSRIDAVDERIVK